MAAWQNWSGSLKFNPNRFYEPATVEELSSIVKNVLKDKEKIRVAGAGHSSSPLVVADNIVSLRNFHSVAVPDKSKPIAWAGAGLTVKEAGIKLLEHGLSMHNTGDVDVQILAGAISTGTHGSGFHLQNLSSMLTGCILLCSDGSVKEFTEEIHGSNLFNALRVSLGTLGIIISMRLKLVPAFRLERSEWCTHADNCIANLHDLIEENRNFDFYWYPRNDLVKIRILNEPGKGMQKIDDAVCVDKESGWAAEVLPRTRELKFDEMEYAIPSDAGPSCFSEIRKIIKEKFRKTVAWRVLYRTVAADDFMLSPASGRDTVTISLHQNAGLSFMEYFRTLEPVFRSFEGRPHWGKKHTLSSKDLEKMYKGWIDFLSLRRKLDPENIFMNEYLEKQIFGLL